MELRRLGAALRKRKALVIVSAIIGILLAAFALYDIRLDRTGERPRFTATPRPLSKYETQVSLLVDMPRFAIGRSDVDSARAGSLARTYAYLTTSDPVMKRLEAEVGKPLQALTTGASTEGNPVFQIKVEGSDPKYITMLASTHARIFREYLVEQQMRNGIPKDERMVVQVLGSPTVPEKIYSRAIEIGAVLVLVPILIAVSIALVLDNLSRSAEGEASPQAPLVAVPTQLPTEHPDSAQGHNAPEVYPWTL